jgi:hypothetical protein
MPIESYDPLQAPNAEEWLALGEDERMELAADHHTRARVELPNGRVHAIMHVIVDNQAAMGDATLVHEKLRQLMAQGLNRHQSIHAMASVLVKHMHEVLGGSVPATDTAPRYYAALKRIDARKWLRSG